MPYQAWGEAAAGGNASGSPLALPSLESIWGADLQPQAPAAVATAESSALVQPGTGRSRSRFQFAQDAGSEQQQQLVFQQQQAAYSMQQQQQPWLKPSADAGRALLQQLQQHGAAQPQPHAAAGNGVVHVQQQGGGPFNPPAEQMLAMGTPPGFGLGPTAAGSLRAQPPPQNGYHRGLPLQAQDGQGLEARWLDAAQRFHNMAV